MMARMAKSPPMGVEKLSLGGLKKSLDKNPQISPIGATVSQVGT